jgi:hypothetical protein
LHPRIGSVRPGRGDREAAGGLRRATLAGVLALALVVAPSVGLAGEKAKETSRESGLGAAAAISSLVYAPVKLVYALGGLVVGGCAWIFTAGDSEVAEKVFTRSLRGDYVITPSILQGEDSLEFIGRDIPAERVPTEAVASASSPSTDPYVYETTDDSGYDEMGW